MKEYIDRLFDGNTRSFNKNYLLLRKNRYNISDQ